MQKNDIAAGIKELLRPPKTGLLLELGTFEASRN